MRLNRSQNAYDLTIRTTDTSIDVDVGRRTYKIRISASVRIVDYVRRVPLQIPRVPNLTGFINYLQDSH